MPPDTPRHRRLFPIIVLAGALLALVFGGYLVLGRPLGPARELMAPTQNGAVLYEVPLHASTSFLAFDLYDKGFIAFPRVLKAFIRFTSQEKRVRAGFYYLPPRNSVLEMAFKLTAGKMATQSVTIPEGKASWEIYGILKERFPMDSLLFDSLVHSPEFARSLGLEAPGLEGYLFPDTYVLPYRVAAGDALRAMAHRFLVVAESLSSASDVLQLYGRHGWVTLASIVEKEAAVHPEQSLIAGVFYNRLRQGWPLGADPTVRFILKKLTGPIYASELAINSPYNTRRYPGLPPGPICNPGTRALTAALKPGKTEMMFFVAKDDGTREHFFSATNPEHDHYKAQAAENRKIRTEEARLHGQISAGTDPASIPSRKPH